MGADVHFTWPTDIPTLIEYLRLVRPIINSNQHFEITGGLVHRKLDINAYDSGELFKITVVATTLIYI